MFGFDFEERHVTRSDPISTSEYVPSSRCEEAGIACRKSIGALRSILLGAQLGYRKV
jgi:hypothetical protein